MSPCFCCKPCTALFPFLFVCRLRSECPFQPKATNEMLAILVLHWNSESSGSAPAGVRHKGHLAFELFLDQAEKQGYSIPMIKRESFRSPSRKPIIRFRIEWDRFAFWSAWNPEVFVAIILSRIMAAPFVALELAALPSVPTRPLPPRKPQVPL